MWCNSLTLHFPTEPFQMLSIMELTDRNIKPTGIKAVWHIHIHIDIQLLVPALTLTFLVLFFFCFPFNTALSCMKNKNGIKPVSSWNLKRFPDSCQHYITLFPLTSFYLKSFEEIWHSMLRELLYLIQRGYMFNWRCTPLMLFFWHDHVPRATWKSMFE